MTLSRIDNFDITQLDIDQLPIELFEFAERAKVQGIVNNASVAAMKIGKWGKEAWWTTWHNGAIISISGCHEFNNFEHGCWRLMVRTATLKEYRGRAPGSIKKIHNDFNWGHILPYQVEYAKQHGAKRLVFTTNSSSNGDVNSFRTNRVVANTLVKQGLVNLIARDVDIFYTRQNVWEIL